MSSTDRGLTSTGLLLQDLNGLAKEWLLSRLSTVITPLSMTRSA